MPGSKLAAAVLLLLSAHAIALAGPTATFQGLGTGAHAFSSATAISADGSTVVGNTFDETGSQAFRWTRGGGLQSLGGINGDLGTRSFAQGVNADGSVVVGRAELPDNVQAFRWTAPDGMVGAGKASSEFNDVSADGSTAVGSFEGVNAAIWTTTGGWQPILTSTSPVANAVSSDGRVVVGRGLIDAFRWTEATGAVEFEPFLDNQIASSATDVSADGLVIVGQLVSQTAVDPALAHAYRWTQAGGYQLLTDDSVLNSLANATDGDGSTIVGDLNFSEAFIWDQANGARGLQQLLTDELGVGNLAGWSLTTARGISADGKTIVGQGRNPRGATEAWIVTLPDDPTPSPVPLPASVGPGIVALTLLGVSGQRVKWLQCGWPDER
jgi:uncharacterized membrane protein